MALMTLGIILSLTPIDRGEYLSCYTFVEAVVILGRLCDVALVDINWPSCCQLNLIRRRYVS